MTSEQLWNQLCQKYPALSDKTARLEFTSENLKKLLDQVHQSGVYHGKKQASGFDQFFGDIFKRTSKKGDL